MKNIDTLEIIANMLLIEQQSNPMFFTLYLTKRILLFHALDPMIAFLMEKLSVYLYLSFGTIETQLIFLKNENMSGNLTQQIRKDFLSIGLYLAENFTSIDKKRQIKKKIFRQKQAIMIGLYPIHTLHILALQCEVLVFCFQMHLPN